jgi:acyl dehydratase
MTGAIASHIFTTRNLREGENAAHSRAGAQARGFRGSIVGGAIVYGQMIRPLIDRYGAAWLERGQLDLRFKAPAYDDDTVEARFEPPIEPASKAARGDAAGSSFAIRALNERGEELISMTATLPGPAELPPPDPRSRLAPIEWEGERVVGTYELMAIDRPFRAYRFSVGRDEQREYCRSTADEAPLYLDGARPAAHPGIVMAQGSRVVANQFVMPFWIHAGSVVRHRRLIHIGDQVDLHCVPIEKWKRGESDWVRFYQVYLVDGEPAVEVLKTSVIKVAQRAAHSSQQRGERE